MPPFCIPAAFVAINLVTFAMFALDKALAQREVRRVPESTLLWLALLGGTPGAYAARSLFRHKTRKQPFSTRLLAIALVQAIAIGGLIGWFRLG